MPTRPDQTHFELPAVVATLRDAGTLVLYGASGVLGAYAEFQQDMRTEAEGWV